MSLKTKIFIEKAKNTHGDKYDYSLVAYIHSNKKVEILCNTCKNSFKQLPYNHFGAGKGCPICYRNKSREIQKLTLNEFVEKSKKVHKNRYDYSLVKYKNNRFKVDIKCNRCKSIFKQRPMHHFVGNGCPSCWYKNYTSKPEKEFLNIIGIKQRQQKIGDYLVDGIDGKVIYEFLGDFWHGNPIKFKSSDINVFVNKPFEILYKETVDRFINLKRGGYTIKYIWESDWKNFKIGTSKLKIKTFSGNKL